MNKLILEDHIYSGMKVSSIEGVHYKNMHTNLVMHADTFDNSAVG